MEKIFPVLNFFQPLLFTPLPPLAGSILQNIHTWNIFFIIIWDTSLPLIPF